MLDPSVIMAMANMADQKKQAAISGGVGLWQLLQAKKMNEGLGDRPIQEVPQSVLNANVLSQRMAANRFLPNQNYAEQSLNTSLAQGADNIYDSAGSSSEALGALTNLYGNRMGAQNDLASMAANNANNNMANYIGDLRSTAPYELQAFQFNEVMPWEQKAAAIQAMRGAGFENFIGGIKGNASANTLGAADIYKNQSISSDIESREKAMKADYEAQVLKIQEDAKRNAMSPTLNAPTFNTNAVNNLKIGVGEGQFQPMTLPNYGNYGNITPSTMPNFMGQGGYEYRPTLLNGYGALNR